MSSSSSTAATRAADRRPSVRRARYSSSSQVLSPSGGGGSAAGSGCGCEAVNANGAAEEDSGGAGDDEVGWMVGARQRVMLRRGRLGRIQGPRTALQPWRRTGAARQRVSCVSRHLSSRRAELMREEARAGDSRGGGVGSGEGCASGSHCGARDGAQESRALSRGFPNACVTYLADSSRVQAAWQRFSESPS